MILRVLRVLIFATTATAFSAVAASPLGWRLALSNSPSALPSWRRQLHGQTRHTPRIVPSFSIARGGGVGPEPAPGLGGEEDKESPRRRRRRGIAGRLNRYVEQIFDEADTNRDGSISASEVYELVLKLYIRINRQAPIPAPSRAKVEEQFRKADVDKSGRLDREEFHMLAVKLVRRATTRMAAHKAVKLLCAPMLAVEIVAVLAEREWVGRVAERVIPSSVVGAKVAEVLKTPDLWRTVLTVTFVATLGNVVLGMVNFFMERGDREKAAK